jgi:23S rRNA (guanosine2251-2'-O)-methyltransferase
MKTTDHRTWSIPIKSDKRSSSNLIPGLHAVKEALNRSPGVIDGIWIAEEKCSPRVQEIIAVAEENTIPVHFRKASDVNALLPDIAHQGIVAFAKEFQYIDLKQLIHHTLSDPNFGLLIAADHITDEGNLGALIRTAVFFGAHGLILPKDRSAQVTERVRKRSSGAYIHLPVAKVVNLGRALDLLYNKGFWIIGAAGEGPESIFQCDWNRDIVLVLGREDKGLTDSIRKRCHQIVHIPGTVTLDSLNVSVAGGVILSEIVRQRRHHTR